MNAPACITIDFESFPIRQRPDYPPRPVGVAIKWPGQPSHYYACGHPTGNNCTPQDAYAALRAVWDSSLPILCHNAKFDTSVAYEQLGLPRLPWARVHDTMFLAYLCDPHARQLGLKELAVEWLKWPAEERDAVAGWVMEHDTALLQTYPWNRDTDPATGQLKNTKRITKSKTGAWIFAAPGALVGEYACGDVDRTAALFEEMWPIVQRNGMGAAYDRERELMLILQRNEEEGMRADVPGLTRDCEEYGADMERTETWLRAELRASGLNFDSDQDVAAVLNERGLVQPDKWQTTASGQLSMSKENLLPEYFTDPRIASALGYRNRLKTCLTMFMGPWLDQALRYNGYITTNWNQTRGQGQGGTRTGRPSTNHHNFLNISKDFESKRDDGYMHPAFLGVRNLPLCRKYVLPDEGEVFLHRDFAGQEMRVFAHGEQGALWGQFNENPALDPHEFIGAELQRVAGREIERTRVKALNFQSLYGGGIPALQRKLRCSFAEAQELKKFHNAALPGRILFNDEIKRIVRRGDPIRTVGGRLYYPEPPDADGRSKEYKLINYWTQGSAADLTKQTIIDWHNNPDRTARFLVTVYDEVNVSAAVDHAEKQMRILKSEMEKPRLSVPMLSDGKRGLSWGSLEKCA